MPEAPDPSPHAHALFDQITSAMIDGDSDDTAYVVVIPSAAHAALGGTTLGEWMAERAAILQSVATAVEELRARFGLNLHIATRTGAELGDDRVDRILAVEVLHCAGFTMDARPPLDQLMPGHPRPRPDEAA